MARSEFIEQLVEQASELFRGGNLREDAESRFRVLLQGAFARLDLVTRDEFDAQQAVLRRTRERVEAMEKQLAALNETLDELEQQKGRAPGR
jgi:ubiquinone biosynthesis accessory factor UbiK